MSLIDCPRVLIVVPALYRCGAVDVIVNIAEELVHTGMDVEILALQDEELQSSLPNKSVKLNFALGKNQPYRWVLLPILLIRLIQSAWNSDIIILTWESGAALEWTSRVAYWLRKPTLAIVQNNIQESIRDYSQSGNNRHPRNILRWAYAKVKAQYFGNALRWAYAKAKAIVCVSEALIDIVEQEVSRDKTRSISNGIDIERVRKLANSPCPSEFISDDIPFMVGLGRLAPQKGFDILIQSHSIALKKGIRHRLVLIGEGPEKPSLVKLCNSLGIEDSVVFLGYLNNPHPVIAQASLFCLSSRYEGRPLSLMEACVLGVPTVSTDCLTGPRGILEDGLYGDLVETESVEALSDAIERHFREPQRLLEKAQASAKFAERFSIKVCAQKYSDLIRRYA